MFTKLYLRFAIIIAIIAFLLFCAYKLGTILVPFLIAYIFHYALKPPVNLLEQKGIRHVFAVIIVFVISFGILAIFLNIFIPAVIEEMLGIKDNLPKYSQQLEKSVTWIENSFLGEFGGILDIFKIEGLENTNGTNTYEGYNIKKVLITYLTDSLLFIIKRVPSILFNVIPLILYILVIPFATFFFLLDEQHIKNKIISVVPNRYFEVTLNLLHSLNRQFGWLLSGMFLSAVIISSLASTGLWIIGLEYPILVGVFAGIANLIPYLGPVTGIIVASLVAIMTGAPAILFVYILIVFLIVNLIDNVLVQPIILARAANLHPLMVIFLVLTGSKIGGLLGMLIAVPLVSLLNVVIKLVYKELTRPSRPDFAEYTDIAKSDS